MKALLLALFISTNALAAIPLNGDDERSISNPIRIAKQDRDIIRITKKMNLLLLKYVQTRNADNDLAPYLKDLANEVRYLGEYKNGELDRSYIYNIEEDINLLNTELDEMR